MLRVLRQGQRWLLWVVIVGVGGVFAVTFGVGGGFSPQTTAGDAVNVDGRSFTMKDFARIRETQIEGFRSQYGAMIDQFLESGRFERMAAESLVRFGVLAAEAERLGIVVSDAEVRDFLRSLPGALDEEGGLNEIGVTEFAEREYGSLRRLQERLRDELLSQKMSRLVQRSTAVSDGEAVAALRFAQEEVDIAWIGFDRGQLSEGQKITDDEVTSFIEQQPARIKESYEQRKSQFDLPERITARHILVSSGSEEDSQTEALAAIDAARKRIEAGEDFATVAEEVSSDPGTKEQGGLLGTFGRGTMVTEFEEAAFALSVGELSAPVVTPFGVHLIRLDEKLAPELVSEEKAQEEIARDILRIEKSKDLAERAAGELLSAVRDGASLTEAVRSQGLTLERPAALRRNSPIEGLGAAVEVVESIFANDRVGSLPEVFDVGVKKVLVEVLDRRVPGDDELEGEVKATASQLRGERSVALEANWVAAKRGQLEAAGRLYVNPEVLEP